jgi:hypothetical protein
VPAPGLRKATSLTAPGEDLDRRSRTGVRFPAAPLRGLRRMMRRSSQIAGPAGTPAPALLMPSLPRNIGEGSGVLSASVVDPRWHAHLSHTAGNATWVHGRVPSFAAGFDEEGSATLRRLPDTLAICEATGVRPGVWRARSNSATTSRASVRRLIRGRTPVVRDEGDGQRLSCVCAKRNSSMREVKL